MEREALKLALITLEGWDNHDKWVWPETALEQAKRNTEEAITAIKEALVQPEQEPVAWIDDGCSGLIKRPLSFFRSTRAEQVAFEDGIIFAKILYGIGVDDE